MEAENLHFFVEGRVQGVGFRRFVLRKAEALSITGWVQNTFDRRVEVFARGNSDSLSSFLQACQKGPLFASVTSVVFADAAMDAINQDTLKAPCLEGAFVIRR